MQRISAIENKCKSNNKNMQQRNAGSNATNGEKSILMELISKVSWTPSVRFYGSPFSYGFPISCKSVVMRYAILGYFRTIEKWIS